MRIGVITDRSGEGSRSYATAITEGLVFGADEINAAGGVLGEPIELLIEDDAGEPERSEQAMSTLVEARSLFVLSLSNGLATLAAQWVSLASGTPHLTPSQSGSTLTTQLENPWFWQTGPMSTIQVGTLVSHCKARGWARIAVLGDDSRLGSILSAACCAGVEASGLRVVASESIASGSRSADPAVERLRDAGPDTIFLTGVLLAEIALALDACKRHVPDLALHGSYNLAVPALGSLSPELLDEVLFVDAFDPGKPEARRFSEAYLKASGREPGSLPGYGYDGIRLVADVIGRAASKDRNRIRETMQATQGWVGVMGAADTAYGFQPGSRTGFDRNGMVVRKYEGARPGRVVHRGAR